MICEHDVFKIHIVLKSGTLRCMQTEHFQMFDKCHNFQCCNLGHFFCSVGTVTSTIVEDLSASTTCRRQLLINVVIALAECVSRC